MKFMTWTLRRPSNFIFKEYKQLAPGEPWYSNKWVKGTGIAYDAATGTQVLGTFNPDDAPEKSPNWSKSAAEFIRSIEKYTKKFDAIGCHEFAVQKDGTITSMLTDANGNYVYNALNSDESDLNPDKNALLQDSLRYLIQTYPNIRWSISFTCMGASNVNPFFDSSAAWDKFMRQGKLVVQYYKQKYGYSISDVEIDMEKTTTRQIGDGSGVTRDDWDTYAALLGRIKSEICKPNNVNLRVNIFALTDYKTPSYYAYTDYDVLAQAKDEEGLQAVDEFQLMTYDFSWGGSAPGPSTPLDWLQSVLDYVRKVAASGHWKTSQVYIGNAGYGRRWPLHNTYQGKTFDYKNLMDAQNGTFVHNDGELPTLPSSGQPFHFYDQDFVPFAGFNDPNSDYQMTFFHVYDMFKTNQLTTDDLSLVDYPTDSQDYYTKYSTDQNPIFTNATLVRTPTQSGKIHIGGQNTSDIVSTGIPTIPAKTVSFLQPQYAVYTYDSNKQACVKEANTDGTTVQDGSLSYPFSGVSAGTKRVVALISFPFFNSVNVTFTVNGQTYTIDGSEPWYPYVTNPFAHFIDCGTFNIPSSGSFDISLETTGTVGAFIICDSADLNTNGGSVTYNSMIKRFKKRGDRVHDYTITNDDGTTTDVGHSEIIDAQWPSEFVATLELLRRPPKPSIIWEDMFGPHMNGNGMTENSSNIADPGFSYYAGIKQGNYTNGTDVYTDASGGKHCVDLSLGATYPTGMSQGTWKVFKAYSELNPDDAAYTYVDSTSLSAQLVMNSLFPSNYNYHLEADLMADNNGVYGVRFFADVIGAVGNGYLFILDYQRQLVRLCREVNGVETDLATQAMSDTLKTSNGQRLIFTIDILNGKATCTIGQNVYFQGAVALPYLPSSGGAFGIYANATVLRAYRFQIASLDRWERMERVSIDVDNIKFGVFGSVPRNVSEDEFGLLIYTGMPGNVTSAVKSLPDDPDTDPNLGNPSRAGTIFETETTPEQWSQDFHNIPIQFLPNLTEGAHTITVHMKDAGIWIRTLYVGDKNGCSVAYNSDRIGFIRTAKMVGDMKGIAMWTLGQEDPTVFDYIPDSE